MFTYIYIYTYTHIYIFILYKYMYICIYLSIYLSMSHNSFKFFREGDLDGARCRSPWSRCQRQSTGQKTNPAVTTAFGQLGAESVGICYDPVRIDKHSMAELQT